MSETCMLCQVIALEEALRNNNYILDLKYDGSRCIAKRYENGAVALFNRQGRNITYRYPELLKALRGFLPCDSVADGEIVIMKDWETHLTDFNALQGREHLQNTFKIKLRSESNPATLVLFDLIRLQGQDLAWQPIEKRRQELHNLFTFNTFNTFNTSNRIVEVKEFENLKDAWDFVKKHNLEGLILKAKGSPYEYRRSNNWLKLKNTRRATVEVSGYEEHPKGITLTGRKIRVACNGHQSIEVKRLLEQKGRLQVEIEYLEMTKNGFYRMPTFKKVVGYGFYS